MTGYEILFDPKWDGWFSRLDAGMKKRVMKKILQLQGEVLSRHLKQGLQYYVGEIGLLPEAGGEVLSRHLKQGLQYYVAEIGQHRLCYKIDRERKAKILCFVGDHKEYEKWLGI